MATDIWLQYCVTFGKCDGSDTFDWSVAVDGEEEAAYLLAKKLRTPLESVPELDGVLSAAWEEIAEQEIENGVDLGDEYVLECLGLLEVDPDEINEMVAKRDQHALEFFDLTGKSDAELDAWDANGLSELPQIRDFEEDFEERNPFEGGWDLSVYFSENYANKDLDPEEAREALVYLFEHANGNYSEVDNYISQFDYKFQGEDSLESFAEDIAKELGEGWTVTTYQERMEAQEQ